MSRPSHGRRWRSHLVAVLAGCSLVTCVAQPKNAEHLALRFVEEESPELFSIDSISRTEEIQRWTFENEKVPDGARLSLGRLETNRVESLRVGAVAGKVELQFETRFDAAEVDLIRVRLGSELRGKAELTWHPGDRSTEPSGSIDLDRWSRWGPDGNELRFDVGQYSSWRGPNSVLELSFRVRPGTVVDLVSVIAESKVADPELLASALERPWKVDLENEWRNALLAHPSHSHVRSVVVPPDGRLQLGYGLMPGCPTAVRFIATLVHQEMPIEIFADRLNGSAAMEGVWREAKVDLSPWVGETVELRLAVETEAYFDPTGGLPVWSNPEVRGQPTEGHRPNVVLVSIDTLGARHLSLYGYGRTTSPNLDAWSRDAVVFRNAVTQAPWTLPSHVSIFSGLNALRHGVNFNTSAPLSHNIPVLAEMLRQSGYRTMAITAGGFVHPRFGFSRGFDSYTYWGSTQNRRQELESNVLAAIAELSDPSMPKPFFLFFHTLEVHPPNLPRQPYFDQFSDFDPALRAQTDVVRPTKEEGFLGLHRGVLVTETRLEPLPPELAALPTDLYDSAIAYTDDQLSRLLEAVKDPVVGPTMLVITSDHGEALGEGGQWGHGHLYESNLIVPLLFAFPKLRFGGRVVEQQVRLIDVLPTVLEAVNSTVPAGIDGRSLLPLIENATEDHPSEAWSYAASTNEGLELRVANRLRYVLRDAAWPPLAGGQMLFDLRDESTADRDLTSLRTSEAEAMRRRSLEMLETQAQGLRIRFFNRGSVGLRGLLESPLIEPVTVKAASAETIPVAWRGMGRLGFELSPNTEFTLILTNVNRAEAELSGEIEIEGCAEPGRFSESIQVFAVESPYRVDFEPCPAPAFTETTFDAGLELFWVGSRPVADSGGGLEDARLREQLEALGYLE